MNVSYFRDNIDAMAAYVPGEQPGGNANVIKLNTNENPYPPSPRAIAAGRTFDFESLRTYPEAVPSRFCEVAAAVLDVPQDWILPGNGSDDIIVMLSRSIAGTGRKIAYPVPTFTYYQTQACVENAVGVEVPYEGGGLDLPTDALIAAGAALTFVASPNSPTGTAAPIDRLDALAKGLDGVLAIDEAYVDFASDSALPLARKHENVVILRTLSKGYSLAGLRLGFAVANPELLEGMSKAKQIYNVDALAAEIAAVAMDDQDYKNANAEKVKASRAKLTADLEKLGFDVLPSEANFLCARPPGGDGEAVYLSLKAAGILVRYFNQPRFDGMLRITVGTDEQNSTLIETLSRMTQ